MLHVPDLLLHGSVPAHPGRRVRTQIRGKVPQDRGGDLPLGLQQSQRPPGWYWAPLGKHAHKIAVVYEGHTGQTLDGRGVDGLQLGTEDGRAQDGAVQHRR